jgi:hypothetical protein
MSNARKSSETEKRSDWTKNFLREDTANQKIRSERGEKCILARTENTARCTKTDKDKAQYVCMQPARRGRRAGCILLFCQAFRQKYVICLIYPENENFETPKDFFSIYITGFFCCDFSGDISIRYYQIPQLFIVMDWITI